MRWIYISPHLDDAVLSAGGFLYDQTQLGNTVEIWTIVCGFPPPGELTPYAQSLHEEWGTESAEETVRIRRAEDIEAARVLGATCKHFDVPDCIYRRGPDGESLYTDIYVDLHEIEANLPDQIAEMIAPMLEPDDQIICQLGVGGHIDHVMVRKAVEIMGHPLWYTADIPYLFWVPEQLAPLIAGMKETGNLITEAGLNAWIEAILAYKSQISILFETSDKMKEAIRSYYAERAGFPYWLLK